MALFYFDGGWSGDWRALDRVRLSLFGVAKNAALSVFARETPFAPKWVRGYGGSRPAGILTIRHIALDNV